MHTKPSRPSRRRHTRRGIALVISLGFIVLLTMLVTSYLVSMRLDRLSTHNYSQAARSKELAQGAMVEILDGLREEMRAGSLAGSGFRVNGKDVFIPLTAASSQPARLAFEADKFGTDADGTLLPPTLVRVSRAGDNLYEDVLKDPDTNEDNYDSDLLPVSQASAVSTVTASLNNRSVTFDRWNEPKLLGTSVPEAFEETPPEWIYVTRNGSERMTDSDAEAARPNPDLDEEGQVLGRYAFVIYNTGSLLDINVAGYPSDLDDQVGGKDALRFKPATAYADLTVLPGMGEESIKVDKLIAWRNKGGLNGKSYPQMVESSLEDGFLKFNQSDSPLLSRQDLIAYFEEVKLPEDALPYLTTFSRSKIAPSWGPRLNSPEMNGYQGSMGTAVMYWDDSENEDAANRNLPNVRFEQDGTVTHYNDEGEASTYNVEEGDPLIQSRFSLARLAWLSEGDAVSGDGPTGDMATAIQECFGLRWAAPGMGAGSTTTANGGNPCWNYVGSTGSTPQGHIKTLAEVAAEGREPNFFELLKAAILSGSLGQSTGPAAFANGTMPKTPPYDYRYRYPTEDQARGGASFYSHTLGPLNTTPAPARIPDMQIIRIGANIIDQYDADSYPTAIYFPYDGIGSWDPATGPNGNPIHGPVTMAYGMENLPYLSRIIALNCSPERTGTGELVNDDSGDQATNVYAGWRIPEIYCPHQMPDEALTDAPVEFEIRAYGSAQTFWGWHVSHSAYAHRSGASPVRDFYQDNSNAESVPEATINFEISGLSQDLYTTPKVLTYDTIENVSVTSHEDNMAQDQMPFFDKLDEAHHKLGTTNHFVGFCTGITEKTDLGEPYQPFWVPETSTPTHDPAVDGPRNVNGSCGTEGTPVNTYVLGWKQGNDFHPYSFIEGTFIYNYSTMYMNRSETHDTRIGTTITDAMSPDKWVLPDPRTGRFGHSYAYFGGGPKANNTVYYAHNSNTPSFQVAPGSSAFVFDPHPYSDVEAAIRPGDWILNSSDSDRTSYYADRDGVVRPADGYYGDVNTGDGIPTLKRIPRPQGDDIAEGDETVEQHARRPVVLNRPFNSVGELGYVFRDLPFKTLDLFSEASADAALLDVFSLHDDAVVSGNGLLSLSAGKVNPNFAPAPVLEAIIKGAGKKDRDVEYNMEADAAKVAENIIDLLHSGNGKTISNTTDLVSVIGQAARAGLIQDQDKRNKAYLEAPIRALAGNSDLRTWNLMIDVIAQSGQLSPAATQLDDFVVQGECRYWLHVSIDRYTGEVIDQQIETVYE